MSKAPTQYVDETSVMRLEAYATGNLLADCEDCGKPIPVELSRCSECHAAWCEQ